MTKKWEQREHPLSTFDELLEEYGIEFSDEGNPDECFIPLMDDDGNLVKLDLSNITLEDILK